MMRMPVVVFMGLLLVILLVGVIIGTMVKHPNETDHFAGDAIGSALGLLS